MTLAGLMGALEVEHRLGSESSRAVCHLEDGH